MTLTRRTGRSLPVSLFALSLLTAAPVLAQTFSTDATGVTLEVGGKLTRVEIWGDRTARVIHTPGDSLPEKSSLAVIAEPSAVSWQFEDQGDHLLLAAPGFTARIETVSGEVRFLDVEGGTILAEAPVGTALTPNMVGSPATPSHSVVQAFELAADESIYGLGQHQEGIMDWVGESVTLLQENKHVAVPVTLSNKGYALLWDNPAITTVDAGKSTAGRLFWNSEAGDMVDYYFCYGPDPDEALSGYRKLTGKVPMFGKYAWGFWQCKERYASQTELLGVVNQYRSLGIPIDGIIQDWQYWPSLNQSTAAGGWGSHEFDPSRYPDPAAMMDAIHAQNVHALISVWAKFDVTNSGVSIPNLQELEAVGAAFDPAIPYVFPAGQGKWLDPFNTAGREVFWNQLSDKIFSKGFDGWWLDASEAEFSGDWGEFRDFNTALGSGAKVFNAYPLMETTAVYQGQRAETSDKRAILLTRSAWAGQQRNAAITWSGDIGANWDTFAKQIPAGLNFTATGIPYWNTDIGGFFSGNPSTASYSELFARWFQYGTFCPMFRVHGTNYAKEVWRFPAATQPVLKDFIKLRYHLMPYIYSTAWMVSDQDYTMMRPLVMDFRTDLQAQGIGDQFMFGPAMMASPVTTAGATSRSVYLPEGTKWYDFWTGLPAEGGQVVQADAPIERMPIHVRAGSILPYGPPIQYAMESVDPVELRVFTGADGNFTLYEDEGDNYNHESGVHATIPISWDENARELTIGARSGTFPGMLQSRTFRVVFVAPGQGPGIDPTTTVDEEVVYDGSAVTIEGPPAPELPAVPTGLTATPASQGVSLTWQAPEPGVFYHIRRSLVSGGPYVSLVGSVVGNTYLDESGEPGTRYHYVISAINAAGEGALSSEAAATRSGNALHGRYLFNEASGVTVADASGRGWHAQAVNGALRTPGKGGDAIDLDGVDDHVALPSDMVGSHNNLTLCAWVRPDGLAQGSRIFSFGSDTTSYMGLASAAGESNRVRFAITHSGSAGEEVIESSVSLAIDEWTHVAVTLAGNTGILFINGVKTGRNDSLTLVPADLGATTQNWLGRSPFAEDPYFDGAIDDFRLYSGALSAAQVLAIANGPAGALLMPWTSQDLGTPALPGSSGNGDDGPAELRLTASGSDIWGSADQGRFTWQNRTGDSVFVTRVDALDASDPWAKAGLMIRASSDANAANCMLAVTPENGISFQYRTTTGGTTGFTSTGGLTAPHWLKIVRSGNTFTAFRSSDGSTWVTHGSATIPGMPATALYGLALTSHTNSAPVGAVFSSISIGDPPPPAPLTASLAAPVVDGDDEAFLPAELLNDEDNIDGTGVASEDNDESTYVASDRSSKAQTFTTGSNPQGYRLNAFTFQHVLWSQFLSNGTWHDLRDGDTLTYQIGSLFDSAKAVVHEGVARYSGSTITGNGTSGSGNYLTFDLSGEGLPVLSPNTTYYFEITPESGSPFFELNGAKAGGYDGGSAMRGTMAGSIGTALTPLTGDRVFHADLQAVAAPGYSEWIGAYPGVGAEDGFEDDPDHDGLPNGIESYFGTNPTIRGSGITGLARSGDAITFRHPVNPAAPEDISAGYRWSADLMGFHENGASASGTTVTFSAAADPLDSSMVEVSVTIEGDVPERLFFIVSATWNTR